MLEASFFAVKGQSLGRERVSPKMQFFASLHGLVGSIFSAVWIVIANCGCRCQSGHKIREHAGRPPPRSPRIEPEPVMMVRLAAHADSSAFTDERLVRDEPPAPGTSCAADTSSRGARNVVHWGIALIAAAVLDRSGAYGAS